MENKSYDELAEEYVEQTNLDANTYEGDVATAFTCGMSKKEELLPFGVSKILDERMEQINKHGFDWDHDAEHNDFVDLRSAAMYALTLDGHFYPRHWEPWFAEKCQNKSLQERMIVAGALLAAAIDLSQFQDEDVA